MSEEIDYKASQKAIGPIYPVLLAKDGRVVDGRHRLEADPKWPATKNDNIDTQEKFLIARAVSNWQRRPIKEDEKREWINDLAELYKKQGLSTGNQKKREPNQIVNKLAEVLGLSPPSIIKYLSYLYKQEKPEQFAGTHSAVVPASQRIETSLGPTVVRRHEEEVKQKLLKDPEFVRKVVEEAPQIVSRLQEPVIDSVGRHTPTITHEQTERIKQAIAKTDAELKARAQTPEFQERGKYMKAMMALGNILGVVNNLFCPVDGQPGELVWKCHPEVTLQITRDMVKRKLEES